MNTHDLSELLKVSRVNNQAKAITGMLLYGNSSFIQVLEGNSEDIEFIYSVIQADTRHTNVTRILSGKINKRNFPDWKMGFMSVETDELARLVGYINMDSKEFLQNEPVQTPVMVLRTFAETNKRLFNKI
jgi:Sensors of blue-light using FAD